PRWRAGRAPSSSRWPRLLELPSFRRGTSPRAAPAPCCLPRCVRSILAPSRPSCWPPPRFLPNSRMPRISGSSSTVSRLPTARPRARLCAPGKVPAWPPEVKRCSGRRDGEIGLHRLSRRLDFYDPHVGVEPALLFQPARDLAVVLRFDHEAEPALFGPRLRVARLRRRCIERQLPQPIPQHNEDRSRLAGDASR